MLWWEAWFRAFGDMAFAKSGSGFNKGIGAGFGEKHGPRKKERIQGFSLWEIGFIVLCSPHITMPQHSLPCLLAPVVEWSRVGCGNNRPG